MLVELLSGQPVFSGLDSFDALLAAKRKLPSQLYSVMPQEVTRNELLMRFCQKLIAPDLNERFKNADEAHLLDGGAATFHRQLIKSNLASEYDNELRIFVGELLEFPELQQTTPSP
jgi:serine/threonine-protein kinase